MSWNFYPRSPRGERQDLTGASYPSAVISIHAPREGSDRIEPDVYRRVGLISIHAPREGSDASPPPLGILTASFLSTLPARGATFRCARSTALEMISIHAPREGSDSLFLFRYRPRDNFYPRSPRGERRNAVKTVSFYTIFLSTLPARGATAFKDYLAKRLIIFLSTLPARGATSRPKPLWAGC